MASNLSSVNRSFYKKKVLGNSCNVETSWENMTFYQPYT